MLLTCDLFCTCRISLGQPSLLSCRHMLPWGSPSAFLSSPGSKSSSLFLLWFPKKIIRKAFCPYLLDRGNLTRLLLKSGSDPRQVGVRIVLQVWELLRVADRLDKFGGEAVSSAELATVNMKMLVQVSTYSFAYIFFSCIFMAITLRFWLNSLRCD